MKNKSNDKSNVKSILLLLSLAIAFFSMPQRAFAVSMEDAAKAYDKGNYTEAAKIYQRLIEENPSAALYYNLGNAQYRANDITHAILSYERALKLRPSDEDARFNLQIAQSKTIDRLSPDSDLFFVRWYHALVYLMSIDAWAIVGLVSLFLSLSFALLYFLATTVGRRKLGFFAGLFFLLVFIFSISFAKTQRNEKTNKNQAIIVASIATVKTHPDGKSDNATTLHEGTKVEIIDRSLKEWRGIRLPDDKKGWIPTNQIEEI